MIFSMLKPSVPQKLREPQEGDFILWNVLPYTGEVCMITHSGLTAISNEPGLTWTCNSKDIYKKLENNTIEYLPKGTVITLEQE